MEENSTRFVLQPVLKKECVIMKSKELAEELLKYPNLYVVVRVPISTPTYDHPYGEYDMQCIDYVGCATTEDNNVVIILE